MTRTGFRLRQLTVPSPKKAAPSKFLGLRGLARTWSSPDPSLITPFSVTTFRLQTSTKSCGGVQCSLESGIRPQPSPTLQRAHLTSLLRPGGLLLYVLGHSAGPRVSFQGAASLASPLPSATPRSHPTPARTHPEMPPRLKLPPHSSSGGTHSAAARRLLFRLPHSRQFLLPAPAQRCSPGPWRTK